MTKNIKSFLIDIFLLFVIYSVIGWIYEIFLEVVIYRWGYSDRGVLTGPYCPVYGIGALIFLFLFYRKIKNMTFSDRIKKIPVVFLGCAVSATLTELITSYICEYFIGSWPWQTYINYNINFQGRIALSPSIRFGIGGVIFLYIFQPCFDKLLGKISDKIKNELFFIVFTLFLTDFIGLLIGL